MNEVRDPGPDAVARKARRLRAHIEALRTRPDPEDVTALVETLADTPTSNETPGVAADYGLDRIIELCRERVG
jgi:hypothetical protein